MRVQRVSNQLGTCSSKYLAGNVTKVSFEGFSLYTLIFAVFYFPYHMIIEFVEMMPWCVTFKRLGSRNMHCTCVYQYLSPYIVVHFYDLSTIFLSELSSFSQLCISTHLTLMTFVAHYHKDHGTTSRRLCPST